MSRLRERASSTIFWKPRLRAGKPARNQELKKKTEMICVKYSKNKHIIDVHKCREILNKFIDVICVVDKYSRIYLAQ